MIRLHSTRSEDAAEEFPPLPRHNPAEEARAIINILPADVCSGPAATKTSFVLQDSPSILHLATHGHVFGEEDSQSRDHGILPFGEHPGMEQAGMVWGPISDPYLRVGLALAGANWRWHLVRPGEGCDDGFLTAAEILRLDLSETSLVVLSACETAHGEALAGQAVASLTEAFLLAGAEAVVASLWPVPDDAAVPLIRDFYVELVAGESVGKALHKAKMKARTVDRDRIDVWANYQCFGNPDHCISFDRSITRQL